MCRKCTERPLGRSELLQKVSSCSGFLIIRNSSLCIHFLCSKQEKRKSSRQRTTNIYFIIAGFLIKYSRSAAHSFKQSLGTNVLLIWRRAGINLWGKDTSKKRSRFQLPFLPSHIRNTERTGCKSTLGVSIRYVEVGFKDPVCTYTHAHKHAHVHAQIPTVIVPPILKQTILAARMKSHVLFNQWHLSLVYLQD